MTQADYKFLLIHMDIARQIDTLENNPKTVIGNEYLNSMYDGKENYT